ncbi:MAG TPA: RsmD family RNA methyltransferase, partial [Chitinophagaceae bacterium]|nr:RsmD family RNA methyltransferase [Chitinophagaceae bacterium]
MRIISGIHKGRKFTPPSDIPARPTTDFAKEALFNILQNHLDFSKVKFLDLFAGTGSLDYELYSRGCRKMVMVDLSPISLKFIQKMAQELGMEQYCRIIKADVFQYLRAERETYNLIFAGPPYKLENIDEIPEVIFERKILSDDGLLIMETSPRHRYEDHPHLVDHRNYGQTHFWFFQSQPIS